MQRVLVVGASGDVGRGIVGQASARGWRVAAAARNPAALAQATAGHDNVYAVPGSLGSVPEATELFDAAASALGGVDAVVVSVNGPTEARPVLEWQAADLVRVFEANVMTHFIAAKTFIPRLSAGGIYIGIGGGMADFVPVNRGQISMAAAALRNIYRAIAREARGLPVNIRELLIFSMVNGNRTRLTADPVWITDDEVGRHVCAIIAEPDRFPGPILTLKTRDQAGTPDVT